MDVPIDAGSVATVQWTEHVCLVPRAAVLANLTGDVFQWPHKWGPIITYLASCGEACSKVTDPTTLTWFKIDQLGASNTSDSIWFQETLPCRLRYASARCGTNVSACLLDNSKPIEVTIPDNLKPGYYMMRHEVRSMLGLPLLGSTCACLLVLTMDVDYRSPQRQDRRTGRVLSAVYSDGGEGNRQPRPVPFRHGPVPRSIPSG